MRRAEFHRKVGIAWVCAVCMLFFFSCAGDDTPQDVDPSLQRDIQQRAQALERVRSNLTLGTPRSLDIALHTLYMNKLQNTETGAELAFVADRFYHLVYPYLEYGTTQVQPPSGSIYPQLFESVEQGSVPNISQEQTTFLSSLASAITVLTSNDADQREQAGEVTSYVMQINPDSMLGAFLHGFYSELNEKYQNARDLYLKVLEQDDSCYPARLGLVRIYYFQGNPESAFSHVEQLLLEFPEKMYVIQWAINVYLQADKLDRVDRLISSAIIQFPDETVFLRKRVELLELQGKYEQAGRIATVVERKVGETPETMLVKIQSLIRDNRSEEALALAEKGMEKYPDFQRFSSIYGDLLIKIGRREEAMDYFQQQIKKEPDNLTVISSLLDTAIELGRWTDAVEYLTKLLEERQTVSLLMKAVTVYEALDQKDEAVNYAAELANEYPENPSAVKTYLDLLLDTGKDGQAVNYINRRMNEDPKSEVKSLLLFFRAQLAQDQQEKLQYLQSALLENMQNIGALIEIAELYESLEEYNKAIRYLRQAVALNPDNQSLKRKMRELENRVE